MFAFARPPPCLPFRLACPLAACLDHDPSCYYWQSGDDTPARRNKILGLGDSFKFILLGGFMRNRPNPTRLGHGPRIELRTHLLAASEPDALRHLSGSWGPGANPKNCEVRFSSEALRVSFIRVYYY
jgi:hypothetical protein